jgi:hypothetical protein
VSRPLTCTRCGSPCAIAEDVQAYIDWGPAEIGPDGIVRPSSPEMGDQVMELGSSAGYRACCTNRECQHQWALRRRFEPSA